MSTYGLGIDDAAKVLAVSVAVSKALQREAVVADCAMIEAIDDLASKLSVANLVRLDRDRSPSPIPTSTADGSGDVAPMRIHQPMERMVVVAPTRNHKTTIPATGGSPPAVVTTPMIVSRKTKAPTSKNQKHKVPNGSTVFGGRKRSAEDMNTKIAAPDNTKIVTTAKEESPMAFTKRERSDSLTEVVNAKFADKKSTNLVVPQGDSSASAKITSDITSAMKRPRTATRDL
jgi:hypothetical protein